ncbi:TIGR04282 family arsenosugar biosynthesis glycosyltransferase, partial [Natronospira sp.]
MPAETPASERLTVFCRLPQAGVSKTRLIPGVGAERAAALHHQMALRAITEAALAGCRRPGLETRLAVTKAVDEAQDWFGQLLPAKAQPEGDLGERMLACFRAGHQDGIQRHLIIGTDAPGLDAALIQQALEALRDKALVLGPAHDGGYYLIGLSVPPPASLFRNMPWGGSAVLDQTLARASAAGLSVHRLPALDDVDEPHELRHWYQRARRWPRLRPRDGVSVVMPVLNEADRIGRRVRALLDEGAEEVIVVDGGSRDASRALAAE